MHALARPMCCNSWHQSSPPSSPAAPMTSWRHELHRCTRQHVQSRPSRDVKLERASPRAEMERFQHRTSLSRRPRSLSTHAELARLQHWPRTPPTEVTQYATRAAPHTTGRVHDIAHTGLPKLIPILGSQPAGDLSHKPGSGLPLLSARPAVTLATLKRAATNFAAWWTEAPMGVNSLPRTAVTQQRGDCDLNPGSTAPESSTLTTRLPSHPWLVLVTQ